ncbi:uncharacterized protein LOC144665375 isoform X2 [Oculina patagonica]
MADNSAKLAIKARNVAVAHIIGGFLLICFGIAVHVWNFVDINIHLFLLICIGFWFCITGGLGLPENRRGRCSCICRNTFGCIFIGFSITHAVIGGIIIIAPFCAFSTFCSWLSVLASILILGIIELAIGICEAVCICIIYPYCNIGQDMHSANAGYVMTQEPSGAPVEPSVQAYGALVAFQTVTSEAQGSETQPVSEAVGYPLLVLLQQVEMPPPYEECIT